MAQWNGLEHRGRSEPPPGRTAMMRSPTLRAAAALGTSEPATVPGARTPPNSSSQATLEPEYTTPSDASSNPEGAGECGFEIVSPRHSASEDQPRGVREKCTVCHGRMRTRITPECGHSLCARCFRTLQDLGDIRCPVCGGRRWSCHRVHSRLPGPRPMHLVLAMLCCGHRSLALTCLGCTGATGGPCQAGSTSR